MVRYVDTSDDDIKMEDQDNECTPCWTQLVSKKRGVVSPGLQGPPAQRAQVDDSVYLTYFITVSKPSLQSHVECLWAMSK